MSRLEVQLVIWAVACACGQAQHLSDFATPTPLPPAQPLVIGFLGGWEHWGDPHRSVRKLAIQLRSDRIQAEWAENHRRGIVLKFIRRALDTNRDGHLQPVERAQARIILFGQSFGGAAVVLLARDLEKLHIPVLLTVQIDSVGARDSVIPANVRAAANFYQRDWFSIWGRNHIRAADPARTTIIGNILLRYADRDVDTSSASWPRRTFGGAHAKMELDPEVWAEIRRLIHESIAEPMPQDKRP